HEQFSVRRSLADLDATAAHVVFDAETNPSPLEDDVAIDARSAGSPDGVVHLLNSGCGQMVPVEVADRDRQRLPVAGELSVAPRGLEGAPTVEIGCVLISKDSRSFGREAR